MRRALSTQHLMSGNVGLQIADHQVVPGLLECDDTREDRVPLPIIDDQEITWEEVGRMLMSFEGWQFKLNIRDKSVEF
jgi:hypothetical protein